MREPPRSDVEPIPGQDPDGGGPPGVPRWVKLSAIAGGILLLALVAIMLVGGSDHGPGRHQMGDQSSPQTAQAASGGHARVDLHKGPGAA